MGLAATSVVGVRIGPSAREPLEELEQAPHEALELLVQRAARPRQALPFWPVRVAPQRHRSARPAWKGSLRSLRNQHQNETLS